VDSARRTLADLLAAAHAKIERLSPVEVRAAMDEGALMADIRSDEARERDGIVPGSLHVPRTVFEWRFEPDGAWRNPYAGDLERPLVVLCDHGYSSAFAAALLVDLGYRRAGDVLGGFEAWAAAGLPVVRAPGREPGLLPGMAGPAKPQKSSLIVRLGGSRSSTRNPSGSSLKTTSSSKAWTKSATIAFAVSWESQGPRISSTSASARRRA
jgi:rhodanese-related sulfurtransferase